MNRRAFLQATGAVAMGAAAGGVEAATAPATRPFGLASAPVLMNVSNDGVTVTCALSGAGTGWVEYGETEALGQRADGEHAGLLPYSDRVLAVRIRGLQPGKRYFYRLQAREIDFKTAYSIKPGSEVQSDIGAFTTLDASANSARFVVWNDTHENAATLAALATQLRKDPADFLMWNGDVTNDIRDETKIAAQFLSPGGQAFADATPVFYSRGNHDVRGKAARKLESYVCGPEGRWYYGFRHGPLATIVMDTGEDKPDDLAVYGGLNSFGAYRTRQRAWLEKTIQESWFTSAAFRVAFLHIPLVWEADVPKDWPPVWGEGIKGWICEDGMAKWHDLLVKGRVDLVISGHTHKHAWFGPTTGRPYGQLIGGGPKPEIATVISGAAEGKRMELVMRKLSGEKIWSQAFEARG